MEISLNNHTSFATNKKQHFLFNYQISYYTIKKNSENQLIFVFKHFKD